MIIYNHNKEFIGINLKDLKSLGFANLSELQNECKDFADLFVKRGNYIHNFTNFNWIYYILNSDLGEAKVIIAAKNREFSASLEIETFCLSDAPDKIAYSISLTKLKALDGKEIEQSKKEVPKVAPLTPALPSQEEVIAHLENEKTVTLSEPDLLETPSNNIIEDSYDFDFNAPLEMEDIYTPNKDFTFDTHNEFENKIEEQAPLALDEPSIQTPKPLKAKPKLGDYANSSDSEYLNKLHVSKDYVFDPKIASAELGLPVDLVGEFIGDFVQQSSAFKDELYKHLANNELSEIKLLSHKLKGVAANLRIEDAFEVLNIINTSSNLDEIKVILDYFYKIVAKLEGKELPQESVQESIQETTTPQTPTATIKEDDDIYDFALKFDEDEPLVLTETAPAIDNKEPLDTLDYSISEAVNELGLPEDLIEELLGDFKAQVTSMMQKLQEAIAMDDKFALHNIAINIKGTANNLRITKVSAILEQLLSLNTLEESQTLLTRLQNYINQL